MKIAIVSPYDIFRMGGVQVHIWNQYKYLKAHGYVVKIFAPRIEESANLAKKEPDVIFLGQAMKISSFSTGVEVGYGAKPEEISAILEKEAFDIIHFHEPWMPFLSPQIINLSRSINIGTYHATLPDTFAGKALEAIAVPYARLVALTLDAVIAVSDSPARYIREVVKRNPIIIPNGVEIERFGTNVKPVLKKKKGELIILFTGRLDKRKGVEYLIKAFANLVKENNNLKLVIAGTGDELTSTTNLVKKLKIDDKVQFLGYFPEEDKPGIYASCDIYCSPALYGESFGLVLLEAMASGKPVVATSIAGYKAVVKNKGALLLVQPKNVEELTDKLELLVKNADIREEMGRWGKEEAKKFSWENVFKDVTALYNKVERRKHPKSRTDKVRNLFDTFVEQLKGKRY